MTQGQLTRTFRPPFAIPESLDDLQGPATGVLNIPHSIMWVTREEVRIKLSHDGQTKAAYAEILGSATQEQIEELVNKDLLLRLWPVTLDRTVTEAWNDRFPELSAH